MQHPNTNPQAQQPIATHNLREITELLVRHHGLHEGIYDLAIGFQIAVGAMGPDPASVLPGAMISIRDIGLVQTMTTGAATVDAAEINPSSPAKKPA